MERRRMGGRLLLVLLLLLTGCWDRREIEERSNVLATGVDLCEEGPECEVLVTRQVAIPGRIPLGSETQGRGGAPTVTVLRTPGKDGPTTAAKAQAALNQQMSFGHTRILVFGEAFARQGMAKYVDYVRRVPSARRLLWVAVAEGRAEDVVAAQPSLEQVPALFLNDMFDGAVKGGRLPEIFWGEFLTRLSNKGEEPILPLIRMDGPDRPVLAGLAVFRGDTMIGKLDTGETATFMELRNLRRGSELLRVTLPSGDWAELSVYNRQTGYRLRWLQGRLHANVQMELETELLKASPRLAGSDPRTHAEMEQRAAQMVEERAVALVQKLQQEYRADILALGERVRAYMPAVWETIPDWSAAFAATRFQFEVKIQVRRTGMSTD